MTALPAELPSRLSNSPTIRGAYAIGLRFEQSAQIHRDPKRLIYARILGYLMLEGPSDEACVAVAQEVLSCADEDALETNGKMYYDHYIRAYPRQYTHHVLPCFTALFRHLQGDDDVYVSGSSSDTSRRKNNALVRDGFCCVVTGNYECSMVESNKELEKMADDEKKGLITTNCAHIFAESTNMNISGDDEGSSKHHYAVSMWAVMDRFGYRQIPFDLNGNNIHRLENVLTSDIGVHSLFDELKLWFEPTGTPDTYKLMAPHPRYILPHYKTTVTFTTPDLQNLPLPSPEYLKIHTACARVAHLSGAGEHIDQVLRELEDTKVLSKDGASAEALEHALLPLSQQIQVF